MTFDEIMNFATYLPEVGGLMGLDLGTKTIGISVSDRSRSVATPLKTIKRQKFSIDAAQLLAICKERDLEGFVVGLPRNMDGTEGARGQ